MCSRVKIKQAKINHMKRSAATYPFLVSVKTTYILSFVNPSTLLRKLFKIF